MQATSRMLSFGRRHGPNTVFYLFILAITFGLKRHYSLAGSDDLDWILGPTALMAELISGIAFEHEALTGYLSRDVRAVIAPACAGVNFLIVAFGMTAFQGVSRLVGPARKLAWLVGTLGGAYLLTILVNALRITVSIYLYSADLYASHFTPAGIHRIAGVFIYFAVLSAVYPVCGNSLAGRRQSIPGGRDPARSQRRFKIGPQNLVPLFWYTAITLVVPLLRHLEIAGQPQFQNHFLTVVTVGLLVFSIFLIGQLCYHHMKAIGKHPSFENGKQA